MPSFTAQLPNLQAVGPITELSLSVGSAVETALRASGAPLPSPVSALGMIDTGASASVMCQGVAAQLGNKVVFDTTVLEAPLLGQHIQCLIGRDVLAHGVLVYIGYGNLFSLSF